MSRATLPDLPCWADLLGEYQSRKDAAERRGTRIVWAPRGVRIHEGVPGAAELRGEAPVTGTLAGEPEWTPNGERLLLDAVDRLWSATTYNAPHTVGSEEFFNWEESRWLSVQYHLPTPDIVEVTSVAEARFGDDGRLLFTQRVWAAGRPPESFELTYEDVIGSRVSSALWYSVDEDDEGLAAISRVVDYSYNDDGEIDHLVDRDTGEILYKRRARLRRLGRTRRG